MVARRNSVLAIVPARGGSKGLPGKNIRLLGGHPLIAYSVASAIAAETIDRLIVSTDDEVIAEVASSYGADAPFLRPAELATDTAPDLPLFQHVLTWLRDHEGHQPSIIVQLRPTSPFRPRGLLDHAVRLLQADPNADSVRAVTPPQQHPSKMWTRDERDYLRPLLRSSQHEPYNQTRQLLPEVFWQTGHVDVVRSDTILQKGSLTGDAVRSIVVDRNYAVDIDTLEDLQYAEHLLKKSTLDLDLPVLR